jgi:hypothetical protein
MQLVLFCILAQVTGSFWWFKSKTFHTTCDCRGSCSRNTSSLRTYRSCFRLCRNMSSEKKHMFYVPLTFCIKSPDRYYEHQLCQCNMFCICVPLACCITSSPACSITSPCHEHMLWREVGTTCAHSMVMWYNMSMSHRCKTWCITPKV